MNTQSDLSNPDLINRLTRRNLIDADQEPVELTGGRTNHLFRVRMPSGQIGVLKIFEPSRQTPVFPNSHNAEIGALQHLAALGCVPDLIDHGCEHGRPWILTSHIEVTSHAADPAAVAACLGRVHRSPVWQGLRHGPMDSATIENDVSSMLATCDPNDARRIQQVRPAIACVSTTKPVPIHTDPVPGNILNTAKGLVLIDWQCPAQGDPVEDLATYLSPAMQQIYAGSVLSESDRLAFLAAYPDRDAVERYTRFSPWFHWRLAAYCAWQAARGQKIYRDAMAPQLALLEG